MDTVGSPVMGTTLTAAFVTENTVHITHVGDSRCYLYDGSFLQQLTEDQEFYDDELQAPVLSSYLGIPDDLYTLEILEFEAAVKPGDRILLCSDGLYRQLSEPRIATLAKQHSEASQKLLEKLCEEASQQEFSDNVTVVSISLD